MKATQVTSYLGAERIKKNDSVIEGMPPNPLQHEFREDPPETPQKPQITFRKLINTHRVSTIISVSHKLNEDRVLLDDHP